MQVPVLVTALSLISTAALADPPKVAVFDFELVDTSLHGEVYGSSAEEKARVLRVSDQLRAGLQESGKFSVLDIAPVNGAAHASNLQACGGCDVTLAEQLGADLAMTGLVQKVSELILSMKIYLRDVHTGQLVAQVNADFRGNTDESWSRATNYLLRNRLLAPDYGIPR
jgi:uncharacterized protein DUF2380